MHTLWNIQTSGRRMYWYALVLGSFECFKASMIPYYFKFETNSDRSILWSFGVIKWFWVWYLYQIYKTNPISTTDKTVCNQYWTILMIWHTFIFIFGAFKSQYYKPLTLLTKSVYSDHIMLRASLVPILLYLSQINLAPGVYILYILSWQSFKSSENNPFSERLTQKER